VTLLVALANSECSILLADRRVTVDGRAIHDEYNKVCVLFCDDARVAIAFTGVATYEAFSTSDWLVSELARIGDETGSIAEILVALGEAAHQTLASLPVGDKRLTFLAVGFVYWEPKPRAVAYTLSNFTQGAPSDGFRLTSTPLQDDSLVEVDGTIDRLPSRVERSLRHLLSSNLAPSNVLRCAVRHLQNPATQRAGRGLIGSQCNSAIVPAAPNSTVTTTYHSAFHSHTAYGASVVITRSMRVYSSEIFSDTVVAGSEIRKQDPCWCGSGLTFKECHLRRFGSFYIRHPAFSRPMYAVTQVEFKEPRPSGRYCYVASGYE
jgi:uncharacterized protein YchJ